VHGGASFQALDTHPSLAKNNTIEVQFDYSLLTRQFSSFWGLLLDVDECWNCCSAQASASGAGEAAESKEAGMGVQVMIWLDEEYRARLSLFIPQQTSNISLPTTHSRAAVESLQVHSTPLCYDDDPLLSLCLLFVLIL
jgi:hypothetical protein